MPEAKAPLQWAVALSMLCLAAACSQEKEKELVRPVKTMVVATGNTPQLRSFPGTVEAAKSVDLAFQVPGLLIQEPGREGQRVAKDQTIAQLRQDEFQARLTAAQSQLDQASASLSALKAGERFTIPVADDGSLYSVEFETRGPERVRVPLGDIEAWNLRLTILDDKRQPAATNSGVWISTDSRRLPVKLQSDLPVGSFVLALREVRP